MRSIGKIEVNVYLEHAPDDKFIVTLTNAFSDEIDDFVLWCRENDIMVQCGWRVGLELVRNDKELYDYQAVLLIPHEILSFFLLSYKLANYSDVAV